MLRAELVRESETVVSYALDITAGSAFVATDWAARSGDELTLRLSFPQLLEPVELSARVDELFNPSGPGLPAGLRLRYEPDDRLAALLVRAGNAEYRASRPGRLLLVEDSQLLGDIFDYGLRAFFAARGAFNVDRADSVAAAWERLTGAAYDAAIVDYYLQDATGAELIARVRAEQGMAHLPIIAVSVGGRDAREASLAAGADLFLDKPLVFSDLFNTLRILQMSNDQDGLSPKKRILVFDDSPMVLAVTRAALESAGFAVAVADDLATFEQQRGTLDPDLILVDVQMPEAFGDDVVLALREGHGVRVPILLVSSLEEHELATRAQRSRAAGYVMKNAGMTELVRRCKQALEAAV